MYLNHWLRVTRRGQLLYGTLLPTLETIIKKTKAIKPELSSMTMGMAKQADYVKASIPKFSVQF